MYSTTTPPLECNMPFGLRFPGNPRIERQHDDDDQVGTFSIPPKDTSHATVMSSEMCGGAICATVLKRKKLYFHCYFFSEKMV